MFKAGHYDLMGIIAALSFTLKVFHIMLDLIDLPRAESGGFSFEDVFLGYEHVVSCA